MKRTKRLDLSRITIKHLVRDDLRDVVGGASRPCYTQRAATCDNSGCDCGPSTPVWGC
jgi:hypothetical protein